MNRFQSLREYEEYVYRLPQEYPAISYSTLVLVRRGQRTAVLHGELAFRDGIRLGIRERLSFDVDVLTIEDYGYEFWRNETKIAWYDSQPHPDNILLASTHPHHKHVPPDIKHNRIPAPGLRFDRPNLPFLIEEIERDYLISVQDKKDDK